MATLCMHADLSHLISSLSLSHASPGELPAHRTSRLVSLVGRRHTPYGASRSSYLLTTRLAVCHATIEIELMREVGCRVTAVGK